MKTTVGFLRDCIRGLKNDVSIELKDGMICVVPRPHINYVDKPNHRVNKKQVLDMLIAGKKQIEIAEHFKVTKQAINCVVKRLKEENDL